MKRTVFSLLLALAMLLAALPVTAAEGEFATVNGTPCADLDAALMEAADQAASGTAVTIVLLQDAEVKGTLAIPEGWDVTLDLNGHEMSAPSAYFGRNIYLFENNGTFTICDTSPGAAGMIASRGVKNYGTLRLRSGTISSIDADSGAAAVWNEGIFEMTGGRLEAVGWSESGNAALCLAVQGAGLANITGGELASTGACVLSQDSGLIDMDGVSLSAGQCASAVTISENSICSMKNVTVDVQSGTCLWADGGLLELTGCTFTQAGEGGSALTVSGRGTATVNSGSYSGVTAARVGASGGTIHILDGEFSGSGSVLQADSANGGGPFVIRVTGGRFSGGLNIGGNAALFLSGGVFDRKVDERYLEQGHRLRDNDDGTYTVVDKTAAASVDGKDYDTLEEALAALPSAADKTLTLLDDAALERMMDLDVEGTTLDLNGHTLTAASDFAFDDAEGRNDAHLINVSADDVTIMNGTVKAAAVNKHCVNLFEADGAVLKDLTLDHTGAWKGAPLTVSASQAVIEGRLDLKVGEASWYGINADPRQGSASLAFAEGACVSMTGQTAGGLDVIRLDGDLDRVTVSGAEAAGLVRTGDRSYGFAPEPTPVPSSTPSPTPSLTPSPTPSPTASPTPFPTAVPGPEDTPAPTGSPRPTAAVPTPRPSTAPAPTGEGPVTTSVETSLEDGAAVAEVNHKTLADAVKQAISRAAEGEGPAVTLDLDTADASAVQVSLPAGALAALAEQEGASLTVASQVARVTFDSGALSSIVEQAAEQVVLTVSPVPADDMTPAQAEAAGEFPVTELTLQSGDGAISDFGGGSASVTLPYDLELGLSPECVVVWYLDEEGGVTPCDTRYNPVTDEVTFTTGHFSKYAIAYDPSLLPVPPQRPSYSLPEDDRLQLALPLTIAGVAVVLLVFLFLLGQLILSGRQDKWRR